MLFVEGEGSIYAHSRYIVFGMKERMSPRGLYHWRAPRMMEVRPRELRRHHKAMRTGLQLQSPLVILTDCMK